MQKYSAAPQEVVSVTTTSARNGTALTSKTWYRGVCDIDCWVRQGGSTIVCTATGTTDATRGHFLPAGEHMRFYVVDADTAYIAAIAKGGSGELELTAEHP